MKILQKIFKKDVVIKVVTRSHEDVSELQILAIQMLRMIQSCNQSIHSNICQRTFRKTEISPNKYDWIPEENSFCKTCEATGMKIKSMQEQLHSIIDRSNIPQ
jgi:predicted methyltransferase